MPPVPYRQNQIFSKQATKSGFFYDYLFYIINKTLLYGQDFVKKSDFEIAISPEGMVNLNLYSKINNQFCQLLSLCFGMG